MKKAILTLPYTIWLLTFTVIPLALILYYGLTATVNNQVVFSLGNFKRFFTYEILISLFYSILLATISTVICLVIAYPFAYILARSKVKFKNVALFLTVVPMWMNFLLRTYAWMAILENTGFLNNLLRTLGILKLLNVSHIKFLYCNSAVVLCMVYNFLPFMILPIYSSLDKLDKQIIEAAKDLGASEKLVFTKILFPLSLQGIFAGVIMVFMPSVTTFVISKILGGGKTALIGDIIEHEFVNMGDWHFGSTLSLILIMIILLSVSFITRYEREHEKAGLF